MTREEAIEILEQRFDSSCRNNLFQNVEKLDYEDALWMAISALRSVSREQELEAENKELKERIVNWRKYMAPTREQVEQVWREECDCTKTKACCTCCAMRCQCCIRQSEYKLASFCMKCGRPLTNEAVQMVMERLEALYE